MWAKDGPKRLVIAGSFKSKNLRQILAQFEYNGSRIDQSPKQVSTRDIYLIIRQISKDYLYIEG